MQRPYSRHRPRGTAAAHVVGSRTGLDDRACDGPGARRDAARTSSRTSTPLVAWATSYASAFSPDTERFGSVDRRSASGGRSAPMDGARAARSTTTKPAAQTAIPAHAPSYE